MVVPEVLPKRTKHPDAMKALLKQTVKKRIHGSVKQHSYYVRVQTKPMSKKQPEMDHPGGASEKGDHCLVPSVRYGLLNIILISISQCYTVLSLLCM